jgi:hypothetical protein
MDKSVKEGLIGTKPNHSCSECSHNPKPWRKEARCNFLNICY